MMHHPDLYREAFEWAAKAHGRQKVPGSKMPYVVHLHNVFTEVMVAVSVDEPRHPDLVLVCALLHDTLEDTCAKADDLESRFGHEVLGGVQALTKRTGLPKDEAMKDSLRRILAFRREIGMVKLADRIVNLSQPPANWTKEKIRYYLDEARTIHSSLRDCSGYLAARLGKKMRAYRKYT